MPDSHETFVLRPGWVRLILLSALLVLGALMFLVMAVIFAAIQVDSLAGRFALWLLALGLAALAVYFLLVLRVNIVRIEVGPQRLKLRVPRVRGPLPLFGTIRAELPYSAVAAVETREEVYSTFGLVTVMRAYSVVTRDGARFPLGAMAENFGAQMRFDQAAERIAAHAGLAVVDRGAVRVGGIIRAMIKDVPPWSAKPMTVPESKAWHRRAVMTVQIIGLLAVAVVVLRSCVGS